MIISDINKFLSSGCDMQKFKQFAHVVFFFTESQFYKRDNRGNFRRTAAPAAVARRQQSCARRVKQKRNMCQTQACKCHDYDCQ